MIDHKINGEDGKYAPRYTRRVPLLIRRALELIIVIAVLIVSVPHAREGAQKMYCSVMTCTIAEIDAHQNIGDDSRNIVTEFGSNSKNPANAAASKNSFGTTIREKP